MKTYIKPEDFTRINNDVNGNPRYVCHYSDLLSSRDKENLPLIGRLISDTLEAMEKRYNIAVKRANQLGGRKYNTKTYGGGIVFQSYNLQSLCDKINELLNK